MTDMKSAPGACDWIRRTCRQQVRLNEQHIPASYEKARAVAYQIRKVAYRHIDAHRASPPRRILQDRRAKGGAAAARGAPAGSDRRAPIARLRP